MLVWALGVGVKHVTQGGIGIWQLCYSQQELKDALLYASLQ